MNLNFSAAAKPDVVSIAVQRRRRLVRRIDQQIAYVRAIIAGEAPRASWVWMDEKGSYFVPIKYGRQAIEMKKGMFSIQCNDLDEAEAALCAVRAMALDGQLDEQLTKASTEIRRRFSKS